MPLILSKKTSTKSLIQPREKLPFNEYLGRSYVDRTLPIGSSENVAFPVIDIKKLYQEHPNYITDARIGKGEATSFSYANFERYTSNSKTSKKIKLGFSINLGLFSIGAKRSMTEIYSSSLIQESNRVYGELNVEIKDSYYRLQTSSNINKIITLDYLTPEFKDELYKILTPVNYLIVMEDLYWPTSLQAVELQLYLRVLTLVLIQRNQKRKAWILTFQHLMVFSLPVPVEKYPENLE